MDNKELVKKYASEYAADMLDIMSEENKIKFTESLVKELETEGSDYHSFGDVNDWFGKVGEKIARTEEKNQRPYTDLIGKLGEKAKDLLKNQEAKEITKALVKKGVSISINDPKIQDIIKQGTDKGIDWVIEKITNAGTPEKTNTKDEITTETTDKIDTKDETTTGSPEKSDYRDEKTTGTPEEADTKDETTTGKQLAI